MVSSVARNFSPNEAPCLVIAPSTTMQMTVTRVRPGVTLSELPAQLLRDSAYLVCAQLRDFPAVNSEFHKRDYNENYLYNEHIAIIDLSAGSVDFSFDYFEYLIFQITQVSIDNLSFRYELPVHPTMRRPREIDATILATLGSLLIPGLEGREDPNSPFLQHIGRTIRLHLASAFSMEARRAVAKGGLAAWQKRRATTFMQDNYATAISIPDIARECGLSPSHFTRAFRHSTGMQPHRWLKLWRVEVAKAKLIEGDLSLAEISLACGFGDQSNFTRVFSTVVGVSPGHWQRINR